MKQEQEKRHSWVLTNLKYSYWVASEIIKLPNKKEGEKYLEKDEKYHLKQHLKSE